MPIILFRLLLSKKSIKKIAWISAVLGMLFTIFVAVVVLVASVDIESISPKYRTGRRGGIAGNTNFPVGNDGEVWCAVDYLEGTMTPEEAETIEVMGNSYGERMASLSGVITMSSTDGTNCMRSASLAMPSDDPRYEALGGGKVVYTVDDGADNNNLERIGKDNGWYVEIGGLDELKEGDIMVYNGMHAVVYSDGATWQDGCSRNTVYRAPCGYNGPVPDFVIRDPRQL